MATAMALTPPTSFPTNHWADHLRGEARREAQMVAEDEGRRNREGDVDHLAPPVHVFYHAEGGNGVGKAGDQSRPPRHR